MLRKNKRNIPEFMWIYLSDVADVPQNDFSQTVRHRVKDVLVLRVNSYNRSGAVDGRRGPTGCRLGPPGSRFRAAPSSSLEDVP
eukprot:scaffold215858_cov15-Prasinocladus_malaysianus.AAC.2